MSKKEVIKDCTFCQKETSWSKEDGETPQGWHMKIEICSGCGVRVCTNDPEKDYLDSLKEDTEVATI